MRKIKCAVIGVGYLGRFHAQKYAGLKNAELVAVCDLDEARAIEVAHQLGTKAVQNYNDLIGMLDAVSVVTPTHSHHAITKACLEQGVHVLVEKPITNTVAEADELIKIAEDKHLGTRIIQLQRLRRDAPGTSHS